MLDHLDLDHLDRRAHVAQRHGRARLARRLGVEKFGVGVRAGDARAVAETV